MLISNPKYNDNSKESNAGTLLKITKEINNIKEDIKKTNNNLFKYLPKETIEEKINLINENGNNLLKKIKLKGYKN